MNLQALKQEKKGFTLVELLIVIVVITILAAISIVAYNGTQQRARDSIRKQDLASIAKFFVIYGADNGPMHTGSGCGHNGNGNGWFNHAGGTYPKSINQCLIDAGVTDSTIVDPSGRTAGCSGGQCPYMKYTCGLGTFIYAHLETVPNSSTATDGTCAPTIDDNYQMNYYVQAV